MSNSYFDLYVTHLKRYNLTSKEINEGGITYCTLGEWLRRTTQENEEIKAIRALCPDLEHKLQNKDQINTYKARLNCIVPSALLSGGMGKDNAYELTGLMLIDIDAADNKWVTDWELFKRTLFEKMNTAEAVEGSMVLRAKLDMANPNMHFRDPVMYRIIHTPHHRTGTKWHAYPMYDFAHGQSDYFEGVTHSICTLEFVPHRPLYDKFIDLLKEMNGETDNIADNRPRQIEFNRLNLTYTVMSKRKLHTLVDEKLVSGWDDPRMPTICGMRRRGYSAQSIRNFIDSIGYTKFDALNDYALLEAAVRDDLNKKACRVSAVLNPVKLIITNYPEGKTEELEAINNPEDASAGSHNITFSRELWIEREDFMEDAPSKYFRLSPGKEVRLKNAYIVKCTGCKKDENGVVTEVYAEYDPLTRSGMPDANRKVKGTIHWVSQTHCIKSEVRLYDRLWTVENPRDELARLQNEGNSPIEAMRKMMNPNSLEIRQECYVETFLANAKPLDHFQFQRLGYFTIDKDSTPEHLVFNKTVGLKDTWAKSK